MAAAAAPVTVAIWHAAISVFIFIAGVPWPGSVDNFRNTAEPVQLSRTARVVIWTGVAVINRAVAVSSIFKEEVGTTAATLPIVVVHGSRALLNRSITALKGNPSIHAIIHVDVASTASVVDGFVSVIGGRREGR